MIHISVKQTILNFLLVLFICPQWAYPQNKAHSNAVVPQLDELSGQWRPSWEDEQTPAICNFHGGMQAGKNVMAITNLTQPPWSQGAAFDEGAIMELHINNKAVNSTASKWYPYQILRKAIADSCTIESTTRMVFEKPGILWKLRITNPSKTNDIRTHLSFDNKGHMRSFKNEIWTWGTPRPEDNYFKTSQSGNHCLIESDNKSNLYAAYYFNQAPSKISTTTSGTSAGFDINIAKGASVDLEIVMSIGTSKDDALNNATDWAGNFNAVFNEAHTKWEERYQLAFTPKNNFYSGWLPTLKTNDQSLRRVYYSSIVTLLELMRTNFSGSGYKHVFVTASPAYATTLTYYWDPISYATVWALLDPKEMKAQLKLFLSQDLKKGYAVDFLTLKQVGPWYSANEYTVFHTAYTYLNVTGDKGFLDEKVKGEKVIDRLEEIGTSWKKLTDGKSLLADYGGPENLSETVPSYIHKVPFLNAANIWMMRSLAQLYSSRGGIAKARDLNLSATKLSQEVKGLYTNGKGYWQSLYPDGKLVPVETCIDFLTIGRCMPDDLTEQMKTEMTDFVDKKLWVGNWMRALALDDETAQKTLSTQKGRESIKDSWPGESLRADHGVTGSYDAWPALTIESFVHLGKAERGLEMLHDVEPVLDEGPFGQSRYVSNEIEPVRKASFGGQDYYEGAGAAFAEAIIRTFFGFDPHPDGQMIQLKNTYRGFNGELTNVRYKSKNYSILSGPNGIKTQLK